jgi:hypothetical protein
MHSEKLHAENKPAFVPGLTSCQLKDLAASQREVPHGSEDRHAERKEKLQGFLAC